MALESPRARAVENVRARGAGGTEVPGQLGGVLLSDPRAERVRAVHRLVEQSARTRSGTFLVEGPQAVREALRGTAARARRGRGGAVRALYVSVAAADRHPELVDGAGACGARVRRCTEEVLSAMADTRSPQGVLAVCDLLATDLGGAASGWSGAGPPSPTGAAVTGAATTVGSPALVAVLARVGDPGNAGTVLRTADAAGAGAVVLTTGSVDVHNPKVVRSTAGSLFHLDVVEGAALEVVVGALRTAGLLVVAADGTPGAGSLDLDDLADAAVRGRGPLVRPTAWVFGNEAHGLDPSERGLADLVVRVPLHGWAESLNLASAAAVCLYASARAHRRCATPTTPDARTAAPGGHTVAVSRVQPETSGSAW